MRDCKHADEECTECFQERIRGIQIGASATPTRFVSRDRSSPRPKDRENNNRWERGRARNAARGMPYLDSHGNPMPVKKFAESRHKYRDQESITVD